MYDFSCVVLESFIVKTVLLSDDKEQPGPVIPADLRVG